MSDAESLSRDASEADESEGESEEENEDSGHYFSEDHLEAPYSDERSYYDSEYNGSEDEGSEGGLDRHPQVAPDRYEPTTRVGRPSASLPLPIEVLHSILDFVAERDILSIARLALASRAFYLLVSDDLAPPQYIAGEPTFIRLCYGCQADHPITFTPNQETTAVLSCEELKPLEHTRGCLSWYVPAELEEAVAIKRARRTAEIRQLLRYFDDKSQLQLSMMGLSSTLVIKAEKYPPCHLRRAAEIINATHAPTKADIQEVLSLCKKRDAVGARVFAYVEQRPELRGKISDQKIEDGLDWLCGESKTGASDSRAGMSKWRDELARNKQTIDRFVRELQNPTISHSASDCKCGKTPALACVNKSCARCCTGGCSRHPTSQKSYSYGNSRSFGRYDWGYGGFGDSDDDDWYRNHRYGYF